MKSSNNPYGWQDYAQCATGTGGLSKLFFSTARGPKQRTRDVASAKQICETCKVSELCYQAAVDNQEPWGVWGGVEFEMGVPSSAYRPWKQETAVKVKRYLTRRDLVDHG